MPPAKNTWKGNKPLKKGVLGNDEKAYIDKNQRTKSIEEMAAELNRSPELVSKYVLEQGGLSPHGSILTSLRTRPEWDTFKLEFNDDELKTFEYHYIKFMGQFGGEGGMLPTEERQVFSLIKAILYESRILVELKKHHEEMRAISESQREIQDAIGKLKSGNAKDKAAQIRDLKAEHGKHDDRYAELSKLLKDVDGRRITNNTVQSTLTEKLRGSRDQRVKLIEDSKKSYPGLIRMLMEDDFRTKQEEQMKMAELASKKALERLSKPHKYADDVYDQPILTSKTVIDDYSPYTSGVSEDEPTSLPQSEDEAELTSEE